MKNKQHNEGFGALLWILVGLIGTAISLLFIELARASTIELIPSTTTVQKGQEFHVRAFIIPDSTNYTVNARISFQNANLVSWHTSSQWLELPVPYYWQDYDWGISRTAGYPGGFSEKRYFGTLYLRATETGPVKVDVKEDSMILDRFNQNVFSKLK